MIIKVVNILSGGIEPTGTLPDHVTTRIDYVQAHKNEFDAILISSRYSRNVPIKIDKSGQPIYENEQISKFLSQSGNTVPIYCESASTDTVGGAIFGRFYLSQLFNSYELTVVTSSFHYERTKYIYDWVANLSGLGDLPQVTVIGVDSIRGTKTRQLREKAHLELFKNTWMKITTFDAAFRHMLTEHSDYSNNSKTRTSISNANY